MYVMTNSEDFTWTIRPWELDGQPNYKLCIAFLLMNPSFMVDFVTQGSNVFEWLDGVDLDDLTPSNDTSQ